MQPVTAGAPRRGMRRCAPARSLARQAARAPFTRRAARELGYCLAGLPLSVASFAALALVLAPGLVLTASLAAAFGGLALLAAATRAARVLGGVHQRLAAALLGARATPQAAFCPGTGVLGRLDARLRDRAGWRATGYLLLKLPLGLAGACVAVVAWAGGLFYLSYPLWWSVLPGTAGGGTAVGAPLPWGGLRIVTFPSSLLVMALGAAMLLAAPWATRLVVAMDRWLAGSLLGASGKSARIRELEETRTLAVDQAVATLRRVERDLHDGAQARLVALAMSLGRARERLGEGSSAGDIARARELVDAARRGAGEALDELRDLARGLHPPALDAGLDEALATLAARSALPAVLAADIRERPSAAIETIAYFCAAEMLTNAAKHSGAGRVTIDVIGGGGRLRLAVTDDGRGGAAAEPGGGLAGLAQRVRTVDGSLEVASPPGGPTTVAVDLPLRA